MNEGQYEPSNAMSKLPVLRYIHDNSQAKSGSREVTTAFLMKRWRMERHLIGWTEG